MEEVLVKNRFGQLHATRGGLGLVVPSLSALSSQGYVHIAGTRGVWMKANLIKWTVDCVLSMPVGPEGGEDVVEVPVMLHLVHKASTGVTIVKYVDYFDGSKYIRALEMDEAGPNDKVIIDAAEVYFDENEEEILKTKPSSMVRI